MARPCFSNVLQFAYGKHCFQCQFFSSRCKLWLPYTAGNFKENPSMQAPAKIFRARASEHSSNFCEQFEQRPNFASTFKLIGTIWYPLLCQSGSQKESSCWQTRFQTSTALKHRNAKHKLKLYPHSTLHFKILKNKPAVTSNVRQTETAGPSNAMRY